MILSYFALKVRYISVHFVGVVVALIGVGCMVGADVITGKAGAGGPGMIQKCSLRVITHHVKYLQGCAT